MQTSARFLLRFPSFRETAAAAAATSSPKIETKSESLIRCLLEGKGRERERERKMVGLPFVRPRKAHRRSPRSNASRLTVSEYNARHYAATYLFGEIQRQRGGRSAPLNPDHGKPHSRERTTNRDNAPAVFPPVISPVSGPTFVPYIILSNVLSILIDGYLPLPRHSTFAQPRRSVHRSFSIYGIHLGHVEFNSAI